VVVGLRGQERGEDSVLVGQIVSDPLAAILRPAPLSDIAAAQLVREALSPDAEDAFCAACREETGGNPLLLRELVHEIAATRLPPTALNVPRLRELEARAGARAVSLRLARLPPEATVLARAVAILGDDADPRQAAELAGLDERAASDALDALARVHVLRPQAPLAFAHPVIRAAVYDSLTPLERDSGHARAAQILADAGTEPERVATQLLRSPPAADERLVVTLRAAARAAASRGASESAVAYLRRGLAEPPPVARRADLLVELGRAEAHLDGEAAVEHLREAHGLLDDPIPRAETALLLGRQLFRLQRDEAHATFASALEELAGADAELGRMLEAGLITNDLFVPSRRDEVRGRLDRLRSQLSDATVGEQLLLSPLAYHDARAGAPAADAVPLARRALAGQTLIRGDPSGVVLSCPASCWRWQTWTRCSWSTRTCSPRRTGAARPSHWSPPGVSARRPCCGEAT
jgi:tetratricopeptide (TPR) repeat protein